MAGTSPTGCTHLYGPYIQPLILRSRALARRLEGWTRALVADPSRRGQEAAPQDEGSVGLSKTASRCVNLVGTNPCHDEAQNLARAFQRSSCVRSGAPSEVSVNYPHDNGR